MSWTSTYELEKHFMMKSYEEVLFCYGEGNLIIDSMIFIESVNPVNILDRQAYHSCPQPVYREAYFSILPARDILKYVSIWQIYVN